MARFDEYFLMKAADAAEYARAKIDGFGQGADLSASEIGDGNLNYIFRVQDRRTGRSVVIKQAGGTARISSDFKIDTDRNRIEYELLKLEAELAPGLVPEVYRYDPVMCCCAMEDLSDHVIMRRALLDRVVLPRFADDITTFMTNTLLLTSDVVMEHKAKRRLQGNYVNDDLCEITEDLVYTEPFNDLKRRNNVFAPNRDFVQRELYDDQALRLETAKLKFAFLTNTQCLIHGDLHTGSIFVRPDSTKVIDPEFAVYGPAGYDVGNVIANLIFAWANADTTMTDPGHRQEFADWLTRTLAEVVDRFQTKWRALWAQRVTEPTARYPGFADWYLDGILRDTAGVCGLELCRRTVGLAQVKDLTSILEPERRIRAERLCLALAKRCILQQGAFRTGADYLAALAAVASEYPRP